MTSEWCTAYQMSSRETTGSLNFVEFHDVDVRISVADSDAAVEEDTPFRDDPNDLIYEPETKTEKPRRRTTIPQKEVKKEESEKEEEENDVKKERSRVKIVFHRKKPPVQYVRCEMEGCGTVLAHPRYLQHHIKYQHLLKKKYVCDHPSCGRLFRLQKQLLRHAKHHTGDRPDYIRTITCSLSPSCVRCEICGFTCRQKASLNWHMKKHDAEASYQFSCSICSKKFEKKDSVVAHKAKSHPEVLIAEALAANGGAVISSPHPDPRDCPSAHSA
ncbi:E3 ubiquitin-protein ligase ZFP91 [Nibea albiflora]|uniref:E3 ubiquitin-protein ligase ZFP91 n=1 Tax=Nibea albiflora TaxID=240163 RepID=A0ACB7EWN1_NIBAL|nr:E3 ubiquitin-protein ligase ZFP91 [Nibea albiflora]